MDKFSADYIEILISDFFDSDEGMYQDLADKIAAELKSEVDLLRSGFVSPPMLPMFRGMIVCPECGNKRCPKATDENLACTHSNKTGQKGSRYA